MDGDELVRDYLGRLEAASWPLSPDRRAELGAEVRDHIESALAEAGRRDSVTVHNVLERLGRPEEIVATEADAGPIVAGPGWVAVPVGSAAATGRTWGALEIAAVLFLTVGAILLPIVGPILGLVLVWFSTRWTTRDKLIATAIIGLVFFLPLLGILTVGSLQGG